VTLAYEVLNADTGERLVTGWTQHVCVDQHGQVRRLPEELLRSMKEGT
jgi:acyl-CoA thioesterase FadM